MKENKVFFFPRSHLPEQRTASRQSEQTGPAEPPGACVCVCVCVCRVCIITMTLEFSIGYL